MSYYTNLGVDLQRETITVTKGYIIHIVVWLFYTRNLSTCPSSNSTRAPLNAVTVPSSKTGLSSDFFSWDGMSDLASDAAIEKKVN